MTISNAYYVPNGPNLLADMGGMNMASPSSEEALRDVGRKLEGSVEAVIIVTPHFVTSGGIGAVGRMKLDQIFDFYGFPPEFCNFTYEPPGSPEIAGELVKRGQQEGLSIGLTEKWGLDHGAWTPLIYMLPGARTPIIPVSVDRNGKAEDYEKLGRIIRGMAQERNIALISTGSIIHRLDLFQHGSQDVPEDAKEYLSRVVSALKVGNWDSIWNIPDNLYRAAMPEGGDLPMRVLSGFTGSSFNAEVLANETVGGSVSITTIRFSSKAQ